MMRRNTSAQQPKPQYYIQDINHPDTRRFIENQIDPVQKQLLTQSLNNDDAPEMIIFSQHDYRASTGGAILDPNFPNFKNTNGTKPVNFYGGLEEDQDQHRMDFDNVSVSSTGSDIRNRLQNTLINASGKAHGAMSSAAAHAAMSNAIPGSYTGRGSTGGGGPRRSAGGGSAGGRQSVGSQGGYGQQIPTSVAGRVPIGPTGTRRSH